MESRPAGRFQITAVNLPVATNCPCQSGLKQPISEPSPGPHFVLRDPYRGLESPSPNRRDPWLPQIVTIAAPGRPGSVARCKSHESPLASNRLAGSRPTLQSASATALGLASSSVVSCPLASLLQLPLSSCCNSPPQSCFSYSNSPTPVHRLRLKLNRRVAAASS